MGPVVAPNDVLDFWFGELDTDGAAPAAKAQRWWLKDPAFDTEIKDRFGPTFEGLLQRVDPEWLDSATSRLAAIIVLDQFGRNIHRDTASMYAGDAIARSLALEGVSLNLDQSLATDMRTFFYMPLMHAEDLEAQDQCVRAFEAHVAQAPESCRPRLERNLHFARLHRDIIVRFGRYPHRNVLLGRTSTSEEAAFLEEDGSSF